MSPTAAPRASRWEILGAWLHLWTPPRGVRIPPPPSARRIAAWAALALLVVGVTLAVAVPRIDSAKDTRAERAAAAERARAEAGRAETIRAQRASFGVAPADDLDAQQREARGAILADAHARHAAGELPQRAREVTCAPSAGGARGDLIRLSCVAATARVDDVVAGSERALGYPFALVLQPSTGRYAWCRSLPVPAEGALAGNDRRIAQPAACRGDVTPAR